jgi:hypothetical protein
MLATCECPPTLVTDASFSGTEASFTSTRAATALAPVARASERQEQSRSRTEWLIDNAEAYGPLL